MNILILHRIPYHKINYHLSIDHDDHQVTYIGLAKNLANLPTHIHYQTVEIAGMGNLAEEVLAAIHSESLSVDLVISLSETELADAARVREALGLPGAGSSEIHQLRDKSLMRQLVAQQDIPVPRTMPLARFIATKTVPWTGKTILKPLDQAAEHNARIFASANEILAAINQNKTGMARLDQSSPLVDLFAIEECISGETMHYDGLVRDGTILIMQASQYVGNCLLYSQGQPLGSVQVETSTDDIRWAQKVITATGIRQGAFHLELVKSLSGRVFLEIANRAGGASVVETFRMATGINLITAELTLLLGEELSIKVRKKSKRFGWFVFPGHHLEQGTRQIIGHAPYLDHAHMLRYEILGKSCPLPREITYQPNCVPMSGLIGGASGEAMCSWLKKMFRDVKIRTVSNGAPVKK